MGSQAIFWKPYADTKSNTPPDSRRHCRPIACLEHRYRNRKRIPCSFILADDPGDGALGLRFIRVFCGSSGWDVVDLPSGRPAAGWKGSAAGVQFPVLQTISRRGAAGAIKPLAPKLVEPSF